MNFNPHFDNTKEELNNIGCGFCLAKWTQVTMHLQDGRTHSCHHPDTHKISVAELKRNPSALHNTKYKKKMRKQMLEGKRPKECSYCWNVEDNSPEFSDRIFKSSEEWSFPHLENIKNSNWDDDFNPTYVEVIFSNSCNFKCSYCGPSFSSKWVEEMKQYGAYPTSTLFNDYNYYKESGRLPIENDKPNPYVDAFWKWFPELYETLDTFRITGGEPLLAKDTWNVLDFIINHKNPNKQLNIAINSNLGVTDKLIDDFIKKINIIASEELVKSFVIYTSVDGWGKQAEYGRFGLNFNNFWDNINKILYKCPTVTIGIMSTYNVLSIPSYLKLIDGVFELKKEYGSIYRAWTTPVALDASYLRFPPHQTVRILPLKFANDVKYQAEYMDSLPIITSQDLYGNNITYGYTQMEITKITRIYDWMISSQNEEEQKTNRKDFYYFVNEHDRRRGTNFLKTFPELEDFYNLCKNIKL